jgi:23S rRNA (guanine745-N1)-methyltransferase
MIFACPICKEKLSKTEKEYVCASGHSYDIAAEGYVHLLPPNKMHSKIPGDNKQMVASRRDFLAAGFYQLFSDKLNELVREYMSMQNPVLLDAGCGEGYYTGKLFESLKDHGFHPQVYGFDISKFAVKAAAKRYKGIDFAVGSIFDIPVTAAAADCVIDVFAPIVESELNRVLKPGGFLILAVPGERHLYGLKEILYDAPYENEYKETDYRGFKFIKRAAVRDEIRIDSNKTIMDLFAMTPYYWKTTIEGSDRLKQTNTLSTQIEFDFLIYQKVGSV